MKKNQHRPDENSLFEFQENAAPVEPSESDDFCCELLAWFHVCGGATEAVVTDEKLSKSLHNAAKRLNIEGGALPDQTLLAIYLGKVKEIKSFVEKHDSFPAWLIALTRRFSLPTPRRGIDF